MNEERVDMPSFSNLIPYSVQVDDCRLITDPLEPKICPLCRGEVRLFFINFNDKILMCENTECDYPFGIEELKFYKENDSMTVDTILESQSIRTQVTTVASAMSEISDKCSTQAKLSPVTDEDSQHFEPRALDVSEYLSTVTLTKKPKKPPKQEDKKNFMNQLQELTSKQNAGPSKVIIKKEEYVKKLLHLQNLQENLKKKKIALVNETEMKLFHSSELANTSQVKIDIEAGDSSHEPTIKLNLT